MSYLDASTTEALLEEGGAKKKATEEEKPTVLKIFSHFMGIVGWAPIFCFIFIRDKRIAIAAAAGAGFVSLGLDGIYFMMGGTKSWPKVLAVSSTGTFGIMAILMWSLPSDMARFFFAYLDAWIFGGFVVDTLIAWLCFGVRFTEQMAKDELDEVTLSHPGTQWYLTFCTILVIIGFATVAGFGAAIGTLTWTGNITSTLRIILMSTGYSLFGIVNLMAFYVVPKYTETKRFDEMLMEKYPDELASWEAAHPDHELAQR